MTSKEFFVEITKGAGIVFAFLTTGVVVVFVRFVLGAALLALVVYAFKGIAWLFF